MSDGKVLDFNNTELKFNNHNTHGRDQGVYTYYVFWIRALHEQQ